MKRVWLSGAAGFIGTRLIPVLLERGIEVVGFDNLSTGKLDDVVPYFERKGFTFHIGDLTNRSSVERTMQGCDVCWHLGANTIIPGGDANTWLDFTNNCIGTMNVLESMRTFGVKKLLFASTAAVYGDESSQKLSEAYGPLHPISPYGASKLACEAFISSYSHLYGIYATIFRFSNVVGGGMGHGVTYDFIQKLRKDPKVLEIWGNGLGQKPYFLVEDCIAGMLFAHHLGDEPLNRRLCETYNLGTETFTSVDTVARIVSEEMGLTPEFKHTGGRHGFPGDVPYVSYDTYKINSKGWAASVTSDEAVRIATHRLISDSSKATGSGANPPPQTPNPAGRPFHGAFD